MTGDWEAAVCHPVQAVRAADDDVRAADQGVRAADEAGGPPSPNEAAAQPSEAIGPPDAAAAWPNEAAAQPSEAIGPRSQSAEPNAFSVVSPPAGVSRTGLIVHLPHASVTIPETVREELLIGDVELGEELLRLTDWHTDTLFAGLGELGATAFVNGRSRLVFDPERFIDDRDEPAATYGQGLVYWRGTRGQLLRREDPELRARRIEELYRPYHAALDDLVSAMLAEFGTCTVVDGHSFPTLPLPTEVPGGAGAGGGDGERGSVGVRGGSVAGWHAEERGGSVARGRAEEQIGAWRSAAAVRDGVAGESAAAERPDIGIGTDPVHTPAALTDALVTAFERAGFRVAQDAPYAGTFVPSGSYRQEPRVRSVMIEVRRGIYMNEATGERLPAFGDVAATIVAAVASALTVSTST